MLNRLVIIGAGSHGKVIADIAVKIGYKDIAFIDDNIKGHCIGFPILGACEILEMLNDGDTDFIIAVGENQIRKNIAQKYNINWVSIIHPSAQIGSYVSIDKGTAVMAGAVVNVSAKVGKHCIINTSAIVEHDCILEDFVHISPNAALGGTVYIGERSHIGIGASVKNNIKICGNCVVGVGAAIVKNIDEVGVYVGVPGKKKENSNLNKQ